ncbi:MAG TPA: 30S ribosomal protein S6 [Candidatus Paceibacterota bacterium]
MQEKSVAQANDASDAIVRVYEIGYHIIPTVAEDGLEKIVGNIRSLIEQGGGSFIAEGAPALMRLSYGMGAREGDKKVEHDRGWFGWIKFESSPEIVLVLENALKADQNILRHIVFQTVREETRARIKPTIREIKRTDTIRSSPRRPEEESVPISEVDLDKAISEITAD